MSMIILNIAVISGPNSSVTCKAIKMRNQVNPAMVESSRAILTTF